MYSAPEKFGLKMIGEIDWSDGNYQFNLTVVWQRESDNVFVYGEDQGCSCPSPFEDAGISDLTVLRKRGGLRDFQKHCEERAGETDEERSVAIAELIERMREAGAR